MLIKEFIDNICDYIKYKPIREEIAEELKNHIEEQKESYIEDGIESVVAEEMAIKQMGDATEIGKRLNKIHRPKLDWKLILILIITMFFGGLVVFTRAKSHILGYSEMNVITKYCMFALIGIVCSILIYFLDYRKLQKYSNIIYAFATFIMLYTMFFGLHFNGTLYIHFGSFKLSASNITIPLYLIAFIGFIQNYDNKKKKQIKFFKYTNIDVNYDFVKIITLSILPLIMFIFIQSILSIFIVSVSYFTITAIKLLKSDENRRKKILFLTLVPTCCIGIVMGLLIISSPFRLERIVSSFNPYLDPNASGWQGIQQDLIIKSAKIFGEADDISSAINLFDEGTNFAFISLLAHYGWVISLGMVLAIMLLNIKLIINAIKIKDMYGKLLITAISTMFILKTVCNILMNFNLGIKANFNIPLISYGGENLIIDLICLAFVLSVYRRKNINLSVKINNVKNVEES